jgi:hypothetical protein
MASQAEGVEAAAAAASDEETDGEARLPTKTSTRKSRLVPSLLACARDTWLPAGVWRPRVARGVASDRRRAHACAREARCMLQRVL